MKYCPITYDPIEPDERYSQRGLKMLSPQLKNLQTLNFSAEEQREEAMMRVGKMSIQGVQAKLSANLKVKDACFTIVAEKGHYILKPQSHLYSELPQNEALTMTMAASIGIEVPVHGLLYSKDHSMTYFIKRFDRAGHLKKLAVEDFAQLHGLDRQSKYTSSMEKVADIIKNYCSFPKIEYVKLLRLTLFNFLIGNEDMHLKNFSLITRQQIVSLSPAYDLLNSTIALKAAREELALPLNGKKSSLKMKDFIQYYAYERLELNTVVVQAVLNEIQENIQKWQELISVSFLSDKMKQAYLKLLLERCERLA